MSRESWPPTLLVMSQNALSLYCVDTVVPEELVAVLDAISCLAYDFWRRKMQFLLNQNLCQDLIKLLRNQMMKTRNENTIGPSKGTNGHYSK